MRFGMLNEHREIIGKTKAFDGATLFLPHRLPDQVSKIIFKEDMSIKQSVCHK